MTQDTKTAPTWRDALAGALSTAGAIAAAAAPWQTDEARQAATDLQVALLRHATQRAGGPVRLVEATPAPAAPVTPPAATAAPETPAAPAVEPAAPAKPARKRSRRRSTSKVAQVALEEPTAKPAAPSKSAAKPAALPAVDPVVPPELGSGVSTPAAAEGDAFWQEPEVTP